MPGTLIELLQHAVARHPERLALSVRTSTCSYAELGSAAERITEQLAAHGIAAGARVMLWAEKTPDTVAALAGVLAAGAAVVPVDPRAPWRRVRRMVADAAPAALVVDSLRSMRLAEVLAPPSPVRLVLGVDADPCLPGVLYEPLGVAETARVPAPVIDPEAPAYLLYTSGSTGMPKAVVISHRAARAFVDWASAVFTPTPDDRFASHAPLHFDLSLFDLWVAFGAGASVRLFDTTEAMLAPWLAETVRASALTVWYSVPSILVTLLERGALTTRPWSTIRLLLFAGEAFPPRHLARLRHTLPAARFVNLYGPTETNVCTWFEVPPTVDERRPIAIGRPCAHLDVVLLDDALSEVAPGTVGELCVAGPNLMSAYWNDPALTARRLIPDPRPGRTGHLYRTGDRAHRDAAGDLHLRGRVDQMVKRRGQRIELGDIEAALLELDGVAAAAAIGVAAGAYGVRIDAWVAAPERSLSAAEVEAHLRTRLPAGMIPDRVAVRRELPHTSTGKVDRMALMRAGSGNASDPG